MKLGTQVLGRAEELAEQFVLQCKAPNTRTTYRGALLSFLKWCRHEGWGDLRDLDRWEFEYYFDLLQDRKASRTIGVHHAAVSGFCAYLVDLDLLKTNAAGAVRRTRAVIPRPPTVPASTINALLASIEGEGLEDLRDRAILGLIAYTCAGSAEVAQLVMDDLAPDLTWVRLPNRSGARHVIHLAEPASRHLRLYLDATASLFPSQCGFVFRPMVPGSDRVRERGIGTPALRAMVKRRARAAGIDSGVTPRLLRSTSIATLLDRGAELESTQSFVRHACVHTTRRYSRRQAPPSRQELSDLLPFDRCA